MAFLGNSNHLLKKLNTSCFRVTLNGNLGYYAKDNGTKMK